MIRFACITFFRTLTRHKLYAALNIGGLAVGIAVFLVLGLYVRFETGYEKWLPNHDQIYLIESQSNDAADRNARQTTPVAALSAIKQDLPDSIATRINYADTTVAKDGVGVSERMAMVDPDFFKLFDLQVISGDARGALAAPDTVILTQQTARKYFGGQSVVGKRLNVTYAGADHSYRVAAVIADLPKDTHLDFGLLARLAVTDDPASPRYKSDHRWNLSGPSTYVRLPDAQAASQFAGQLPRIVKRHARAETPDQPDYMMTLSLKSLDEVHFVTPGSKRTVTALGIVGLLTLLIAVVNYINLATALAGLRAREVAMRRVLGADRTTLIRQYLGEAIATTAIAAFIGLVLAEVGLPLINAAAGLDLQIHYLGWNGVLVPLMLLVIVVGMIAGTYPALVLSRFPAAAVLAPARALGGSHARIREALVVLQFTIAIALVIGTMILVAQTWHVRTADIGYKRSNLVLVRSLANDSLSNTQRDSMLHRLASLPSVTGVSVGNSVPGNGLFTAQTNFQVCGVPGPGPSIAFFTTTPGFFDVVGSHLLAGRLFDEFQPGDVDANLANSYSAGNGSLLAKVVLNESAVRALHFASPEAAIGKTFGGPTPKLVIGIVADMRFNSPREAIPATMYNFQLRDPDKGIAVVGFTGDPELVLDEVRQIWIQLAPKVPFDAATASQRLQTFYARDAHAANLFTIGAVVAMLIGCVGLWGLTSFNTVRRTKEIGIRKTLGASSHDIVKLLVGQFLRPVLIANLFALPLAWLAMRNWLADFDDHIALSPLFFVAASALTLSIAVTTIIGPSLRAARATPASALRHE